MSVRVSTWVWHETTARSSDLLVLLALADIADDDGWCWPKMGVLVDKVRLDRATVQRRMNALIDGGLVERVERPGTSNLYRVLVPWGDSGEGPQIAAPGVPQQRGGGAAQARHRVPHGRGTEPSLNRQDTSVAGRSPRRKPERPLPEDWKPTAKHSALASERRVDLSSEAFRFRAHAEANDRRQRDWNAAFTMWLSKARPEPDAGRRSAWDRARVVEGGTWAS